MAVAGQGGWVPSNSVALRNGEIHFLYITQNKPKSITNQDVRDTANRLLAGEAVTIDVRFPFTTQLRGEIERCIR